MTAMNAWISKDAVAIATDTYCHRTLDEKRTAINYMTKIYQLPHLKACFTNQGLRDLGLHLYNFIQTEVVAKDFESLIQYVKLYFTIDGFYEDLPYNKIGNVFIYGFNDSTQEMEVVKVSFDEFRFTVVEQLGIGYFKGGDEHFRIFKPQTKDGKIDEFTIKLKWYNLEEAVNSLRLVMEYQKIDDELNDEKIVGIGGEIQITLLTLKGGFFVSETFMLQRFDDFETKYLEMLVNDLG